MSEYVLYNAYTGSSMALTDIQAYRFAMGIGIGLDIRVTPMQPDSTLGLGNGLELKRVKQ